MNILAATDGSKDSSKAIDFAIDLAKKFGANLYLMHVVTERKIPKDLTELMASERLEKAPEAIFLNRVCDQTPKKHEMRALETGVRKVRRVCEFGHPATKILEFARTARIDLIVVGSRGLSRVRGVLLGSVSGAVASRARCSVMIVH